MWIVMFTGLPASGKSYLREKIAKAIQIHIGTTYYDMRSRDPINEHEMAALDYCAKFRMVQTSSDDVLDMIAANQGKGYSEIFDAYMKEADLAFWHRLRLAVACRTPAILVDRTFVSEKARKDVVTTVQTEAAKAGASYKFLVVEVKTPPAQEWNDRLAARPGKTIPVDVLLSMTNRLTSPRDDEFKYDELFTATEPSDADDLVYMVRRTITRSIREFT